MDAFNDEDAPDNSEQPKNRKRRLSVQEDNCIICLQRIQDRAILPQCSHDSQCFSCLLEWTKHSAKCPLCVSDIGPFIIHNVRSKHDYKRYFISPTLSPTSLSHSRSLSESRRVANYRREEQRQDEVDAAIQRRRHIYNSGLFAKHVASNRYTGYAPHPTPAQISASIELQRRARTFLRRELRVWINLDIEFLMNYIIALIKTLDLRSEAGIKLLADLMDPGNPYSEETRKPNTEHLAHELLSFLRSPYKQVEAYDEVVQYDSAPSQNRRSVRQAASYDQSRRNRSMSPPHAQARRTSDRYMRGNPEKNTGNLREEEGGGKSRISQPGSQSLAPQRSIGPSTSEPPKSQTTDIVDPTHKNGDLVPFPSLISQTSAHVVHPSGIQASLMNRIRSEISRQREMNLNPDPDNEPTATVRSSEWAPASSVPGQLSASRREELLAKLSHEKTRVQVSQTIDTNMDDASMTDGAQVSGGLQIRGAAAKARELMEKRLRAQALLRVKLARERSRLAETRAAMEAELIEPPTQTDASGDVTENSGPVETVDEQASLQHKLRERLLRERLLLARAKPLGAPT